MLCSNSGDFMALVLENKRRFVEKLAFYLNILLNLEDELKVYFNNRAIINTNFASASEEDHLSYFELESVVKSIQTRQ